jgi:hypothetical protein
VILSHTLLYSRGSARLESRFLATFQTSTPSNKWLGKGKVYPAGILGKKDVGYVEELSKAAFTAAKE